MRSLADRYHAIDDGWFVVGSSILDLLLDTSHASDIDVFHYDGKRPTEAQIRSLVPFPNLPLDVNRTTPPDTVEIDELSILLGAITNHDWRTVCPGS